MKKRSTAADRGPGLREIKKRRTRQALIDSAMRLYREKGFDRVTVADIAHQAEVAPRTFFGYFETKEDVFLGLCDDRLQSLAEATADDVGADRGDPEARVVAAAITAAIRIAAAAAIVEPKRRRQIAERVFELLASGLSQYGATGSGDNL